MIRRAFRMSIHPGHAAEYNGAINRSGRISSGRCSTTVSRRTRFSSTTRPTICSRYVEFESVAQWQAVAATDVCQRWWRHMSAIMPSNPDHSPIAQDLREVFHIDRAAS